MKKMKEFHRVLCFERGRSWDEYVEMVKMVPEFANRTGLLDMIRKEVSNA